MSVYLADEVIASGRSAESVLVSYPDCGLVALRADTIRELNLTIRRHPLTGEPAHAEVCGKKSKSVRRKLAEAAQWVIPPPSPP